MMTIHLVHQEDMTSLKITLMMYLWMEKQSNVVPLILKVAGLEKASMRMKVALTFACMNLKKLAKIQQEWELEMA